MPLFGRRTSSERAVRLGFVYENDNEILLAQLKYNNDSAKLIYNATLAIPFKMNVSRKLKWIVRKILMQLW